MFHTADIQFVTESEAIIKTITSNMKAAAGNNPIKNKDPDDYHYAIWDWHDLGIKAQTFANYGKYYLDLTFNCSKLIREKERLELPSPSMDIKAALSQQLKKTKLLNGVYFPDRKGSQTNEDYVIDQSKTNRMDCCVNWHLGEEEKVLAYTSVLNRGYRQDYKLDGQHGAYDTSVFCASWDSTGKMRIGYNLYSKYHQLLYKLNDPEERDKPTMDELEQSEGILRLEIQVDKGHFNSAKTSRIFDDLYKPAVSRYYIEHYLHELTWSTGDYMTYKEAVKVIKDNTKKAQQKTKQKTMLAIVKKIAIQNIPNKDYSLDKALDDLKLTKAQQKKYKGYFDELGLNPVTLPDGSVKRLDNPLKHLDELFAGVAAAQPPKAKKSDEPRTTRRQPTEEEIEELFGSARDAVQAPEEHSEPSELEKLRAENEALRAENQKLRAELEALKATAARPEPPKKSELQHTEDGLPVRQLMANGLYRMIDDPSEEFDFDGAPLDAQTVQPTGIGLLTIREINKRINSGFYDEYYREHPDEDPRIPHDPEDEDDEDNVPF